MNYFKTFLLMTGLIILFVYIGGLIGGQGGMILAFMIAVSMNFFSYWFSDKIVLSLYRAKPIKYEDSPFLYDTIKELSQKARIPMPKVYIVNERMPNAFATGRNPSHSAVAITTGLLEMLDKNEIKAVLAHEIGHIKHRDILTGTIAATVAGAITMLAYMARWAFIFGGLSRDDDNGGGLGTLLLLILAPIAAVIIQLMISRSMEYSADNESAKLTGHPEDLISALEKIHEGIKIKAPTHARPETAHMLIANPFRGDFLASLFSTHPTLEQRKRNLMKFMKK